jgi:hypothetical protein
MLSLTPTQQQALGAEGTLFLLGPAGAGKTTALSRRLLHLLTLGEPAYTMLVLVAEPEHERAYLQTLHESGLGPYSELQITPYNIMAREMVALFWPLLARPAGFARAYQPPTFLSYDLAQLLIWRIVAPMLEEGAFADLRLRPQQIVSQILDTLNRAALNGLSLDEAIERQKMTWVGEADHLRHLEYAATAARQFRRRCLENGLLDLSLLVEVFDTHLVRHEEFYRYFSERYRHLFVDNVEEQTPAGQNFVASLMDATVSTAIAYDAGGGYKRFLAADPAGANQFHDRCRQLISFDPRDSFTSTPALADLGQLVENYLLNSKKPTPQAQEAIRQVVTVRYRREMVHSLLPALFSLLDQGVAAADIAIITPYLDGALRYNLTQVLRQAQIPYYLLRRRSTPREEPRVRAWLTWLALAHPDWNIRPSNYDVAEALNLSIAGLDPVRAALLAERLYLPDSSFLLPAADLPENLAERIGTDRVALYERLRHWLQEEGGHHPLDTFLHRLCDGLLARPPFQPEPDLVGAAVCAWLVRSAGRLRQAAPAMGLGRGADVGEAFINGIYQGLVTADPPELGDPPDLTGVMISTIYGYLLAGKPVRYQVWLETAAQGWWDIPRQPLSNAFVLAQSRNPERPWTMDEEFNMRNQLLSRIVRGLCARCHDGVILAHSDLDRRGQRQDGPLWRALQPVRE